MYPGFSLFAQDLHNIAHQLGSRAQHFAKSSVLLTGCTGFVGRWLTESLLWCNEQANLGMHLHILTRNKKALLDALPHLEKRTDLSVLEGDILDLGSTRLPDFAYAVLAMNYRNSGMPGWAAHHCAVATLGTEKLFRMAGACGCRAVLVVSSGAVYGVRPLCPDSEVFFEESPSLESRLQESVLYGEGKRFLELFAVSLGQRYNIRVPVARCFAFCGAHLELNSGNALASFLADILAKREIQIQGNGKAVRSYLYGSDMAVWLLAMLAEGEHGVPCNVGSERAVSLLDLARMYARLAPSCKTVRIQGRAVQGNAPECYVPATQRIRSRLHLQEHVSLEKGLAATLRWFALQKHHG